MVQLSNQQCAAHENVECRAKLKGRTLYKVKEALNCEVNEESKVGWRWQARFDEKVINVTG